MQKNASRPGGLERSGRWLAGLLAQTFTLKTRPLWGSTLAEILGDLQKETEGGSLPAQRRLPSAIKPTIKPMGKRRKTFDTEVMQAEMNKGFHRDAEGGVSPGTHVEGGGRKRRGRGRSVTRGGRCETLRGGGTST